MIMKTTTLIMISGLALAAAWQLAKAATDWTPQHKRALAASPSGRIVLHVVCAWRDHRFQWHWRGVLREFARS
jgi:hypothetical protein